MIKVLNGFHQVFAVKWSRYSDVFISICAGLGSFDKAGGDIVSDVDMKPLNWNKDPNVGYTVERRPDGGMQYKFSDVSHTTLEHWRRFSMDHLIDSDRLTTNLYDLRQIDELPEEAITYALEVGSDPSTRNIRLAVVLASEQVRQAVEEIAALTPPGGLRIGIFTDLDEAEAWLAGPLTQVA